MSDPVIMTTTTSSQPTLQRARSHVSLDADIIIKNAPDPVFVSDLEGKILSANDAVYELLALLTDEVLHQSLSRFISPEETREFTAALREVIERVAIRNVRLNPRSASWEFFFNDTATTEIYTLSLHDALPISQPTLQRARSHVSLDADIIIKNAPDPVFVSDLEGKIL